MTSPAPTSPQWDPQQYEQFSDHRLRPWGELLARLPKISPEVVLDVGCGNGLSTLALPRLYPSARVVGVDSSAEMLQQSKRHDFRGSVTWVEQDAVEVSPREHGASLVVSNALLQWIPSHREVLDRWWGELPAGGVLAFQVPGNFDAPSHTLMRQVAAESAWAEELLPRLRHGRPVDSAVEYAQRFAGAGASVDAWETTYVQWLDPQGELEHPVVEWVRGSGLRPLLGVLAPEDEATFVAEYAARVQQAYPRTAAGVAFPFRRIFCVAHKQA